MQSVACCTARDEHDCGQPNLDGHNGSDEFDLVIINDLHMGERKKVIEESSRFGGMFERFISYLERESDRRKRKWRLVIAGDMVDFLQVTRVPERPLFRLRKNEMEFGLDTSPEKTAWKMRTLMSEHRRFFKVLAAFIAQGNKCTIISGNHDIEWTVPTTQRTFREEMKRHFPTHRGVGEWILSEGIEFCPWFYYEPGLVWIEHGHQYDGMNSFDYLLSPFLPKSEELMLPVGSLLVRYLLNKLEQTNYYDYDLKSALDYVRQYFFSVFCSRNLLRHLGHFPHVVDVVKKFRHEDLLEMRERDERGLKIEAARFGIELSKLRALKKLWAPSVLYNRDKVENIRSFVTYNVRNIWRKMAFVIQRQMDVRYVVFGHTHRAESLLLTPDGSAQYANSGAWTKAMSIRQRGRRSPKKPNLMYIQVFKRESNRLALMKWVDDVENGVSVHIPSRAAGWN